MTQTTINESNEIQEGKIFAVVGYWAFLCILPLILKKENKFACFHGKQGLVLFIFLVAGFIFNIIPFLGGLIYQLIRFIYLTLMLWGTINALMGRYSRLPVVAGIADQISL
ncbi:MAG: hypothetical protein MUC39_05800 [Candidatus Omnitrophica bacterium]|jgi:uncharacterized membrane protein|nr:hypothetical protein [Candidatus Omnitrophota bacterium]